jgi:hypothetical protein
MAAGGMDVELQHGLSFRFQFCIQNAFLFDGLPLIDGVVVPIFCIQNAFKGKAHDC